MNLRLKELSTDMQTWTHVKKICHESGTLRSEIGSHSVEYRMCTKAVQVLFTFRTFRRASGPSDSAAIRQDDHVTELENTPSEAEGCRVFA